MPKNAHPPRGGQNNKKPAAAPKDATNPAAGPSKKGKDISKSNEATDKSSSSKKSKSTAGESKTPVDVPEEAPKKPDIRTLIGGASWTGKLPVTLLSEHCQKQKWNKPEYNTFRIKEGFISTVILSVKNPKNGETTTLPPFQFPRDRQSEIAEPTALESRHFAATYTLFRISSMKRTDMMLPPKWKDIWKGLLSEIKADDVKIGRAWIYEADPFVTAKAREDAEKARIKERAEAERLKAKRSQSTGHVLPGTPHSKAWERAPRVELGKRVRFDTESLIRDISVWNPHGRDISESTRQVIVGDLLKLGFREPHILEACEICQDKEEVLEWLLTHLPEDDLPKWSLPENYAVGVTMATSDLKKEAMIKRLASGGYATDLCEELLNHSDGDERLAAAALQAQLLDLAGTSSLEDSIKTLHLDDSSPDSWVEEQEVLSSIYGERYSKQSPHACSITLIPEDSSYTITALLQNPQTGYPNTLPILTIQADQPAYIRLSITKQVLLFAHESLRGEQMGFSLIDWLEQNVAQIVKNPGRLSSVSSASVGGVSRFPTQKKRVRKAHTRPRDSKSSAEESQRMLGAFESKQSSPPYRKMLTTRQSLPAWNIQEEVVSAVRCNRVTIISGETGSGKSTQSVQFILDDCIRKGIGGSTNIICTQPRRISALGLADRVAEERMEKVGDEVGYIIRGDSKVRNGVTKITFVTTGVLLRRLQTSGGSENDMVASLANVSHVVIDEVHERNVDVDFLLVLLKTVLRKRKDLKVILMSATADANAFEQYFRELGTLGRVHISGRTFPVTDYYKDDIIRMTMHRSTEGEEEFQEASIGSLLISGGMRIDYELIAKTITVIDRELGSSDGAILVFLPGAAEIDRTLRALQGIPSIYGLPLHASLPPIEQRRVFPTAPKGMRKVIAATNVAETSITIPDVVAVIDTGRVKETVYDPVTSTQKLVEVWASRASCAQRRGRAGRVREGICYKLFTANMEAKMRERPDPEILRVPLEQLCLSVRSMGIGDVAGFLGSALTPPSSQAIEAALHLLFRIGAMERTGELTALGEHLAMIPADLRSAKLLVLGSIFGCAEACLVISALLASRSIFNNPMNKREDVKRIRFGFAPGQGDLMCDLRAYETWSEMRKTQSPRDLRNWCNENFLAPQALRDVESNRAQLITALKDIGFLSLSYPRSTDTQTLNANNTNDALLRALIAASLHPQIIRIDFPATKFAASVTGSVALDPEARTIKFFDSDNQRAFIHPGSVCFEAGKGWASDVRFLAVWERVESGSGQARRPYLRGVSPCNLVSVLLFGGPLELDTVGRGVVIDSWIKVRGWARIGVLVNRLRGLLDRVLEKRVDNPMAPLTVDEQRVLDIVRRLVERDGLDR